mmetsp:Transcript_6322/g.22605  ORF Transcript_6322/g.22605 Transcript_6322/m.22605 type:complete len:300 (-) Transcript_6322:1449-2348(-)
MAITFGGADLCGLPLSLPCWESPLASFAVAGPVVNDLWDRSSSTFLFSSSSSIFLRFSSLSLLASSSLSLFLLAISSPLLFTCSSFLCWSSIIWRRFCSSILCLASLAATALSLISSFLFIFSSSLRASCFLAASATLRALTSTGFLALATTVSFFIEGRKEVTVEMTLDAFSTRPKEGFWSGSLCCEACSTRDRVLGSPGPSSFSGDSKLIIFFRPPLFASWTAFFVAAASVSSTSEILTPSSFCAISSSGWEATSFALIPFCSTSLERASSSTFLMRPENSSWRPSESSAAFGVEAM